MERNGRKQKMTPEAKKAYCRERRQKRKRQVQQEWLEWQAKNPDQNRTITKFELREISFDIYGINWEKYLELRNVCRAGEYENIVRAAAYAAAPDIAEYILMSVTQNKSYDSLAIEWELGKIERMVCGRTDFYACRRLFYHYLDQMLKKNKWAGRTDV